MIKIRRRKTQLIFSAVPYAWAKTAYVVSEAERKRIELDYSSCGAEIDLVTGDGSILVGAHPRACDCSHCRGFIGKWGFRRPAKRAYNSWWTIFWTWNGRRWYIRWTPLSLWKWRWVSP